MSPTSEEGRPKGRLEAFSDGVFAIAITLLVLEIAVPAVSGDRLLGELLHEWPIYLGYFVAFMAIGAIWMEHSDLVDALDHVDDAFLRLNLLLLLFVAFLPFPTRLMAEYSGDMAGERVAVVFFGAVLFMQSLLLRVLALHADQHGLFGADLDEQRDEESRLRYQLTPSLVFYGIATLLGLLAPRLGVILYLLIAVYLAIPVRQVRRLLRRKE
jgi:TMEM175 potassium channel family protein